MTATKPPMDLLEARMKGLGLTPNIGRARGNTELEKLELELAELCNLAESVQRDVARAEYSASRLLVIRQREWFEALSMDVNKLLVAFYVRRAPTSRIRHAAMLLRTTLPGMIAALEASNDVTPREYSAAFEDL